MEEVLGELGLADQLAAVSSQRALQIYQERCVLLEPSLLLEVDLPQDMMTSFWEYARDIFPADQNNEKTGVTGLLSGPTISL